MPGTESLVLIEMWFDQSLTTNFILRDAYNILNVFGDFGGVQYVILLIGGYIMGTVAEFSFSLKAI